METATVQVDSLDRNLIDYVRTKVKSDIHTRNAKPREQYHDMDVYFLGDDNTGYIVLYDDVDEDVLYFVEYKKVSHSGLTAGRQVLVWANKQRPATAGFARHVFFLFLLPKYKILFADTEQTLAGERFWQYSMSHALTLGNHVYAFDRRTNPSTLLPIISVRDIDTHRNLLWGKTPEHSKTFAVISQSALTLHG